MEKAGQIAKSAGDSKGLFHKKEKKRRSFSCEIVHGEPNSDN